MTAPEPDKAALAGRIEHALRRATFAGNLGLTFTGSEWRVILAALRTARTDPGRGEADVAGLVSFLRGWKWLVSQSSDRKDFLKAADTIERLVRERGEAEAKATGAYKEGVAAGSLVTELIEKQRDVAYRQRDTAIRERDEARAALTLFAETEMVVVGFARAMKPEDGKNADWFACFIGEQPTMASYARARAVLATTETDHGRG